MTEYNQLVKEILDEVTRARNKFPPFRSFHEGYAITKEELDELWDEIKSHDKLDKQIAYPRMRKEALHLVAMSFRFLFDFENMVDAEE